MSSFTENPELVRFIAETAREAGKLAVQEVLNERRHQQLLQVTRVAIGISIFGTACIVTDLILRLTGFIH